MTFKFYESFQKIFSFKNKWNHYGDICPLAIRYNTHNHFHSQSKMLIKYHSLRQNYVQLFNNLMDLSVIFNQSWNKVPLGCVEIQVLFTMENNSEMVVVTILWFCFKNLDVLLNHSKRHWVRIGLDYAWIVARGIKVGWSFSCVYENWGTVSQMVCLNFAALHW